MSRIDCTPRSHSLRNSTRSNGCSALLTSLCKLSKSNSFKGHRSARFSSMRQAFWQSRLAWGNCPNDNRARARNAREGAWSFLANNAWFRSSTALRASPRLREAEPRACRISTATFLGSWKAMLSSPCISPSSLRSSTSIFTASSKANCALIKSASIAASSLPGDLCDKLLPRDGANRPGDLELRARRDSLKPDVSVATVLSMSDGSCRDDCANVASTESSGKIPICIAFLSASLRAASILSSSSCLRFLSASATNFLARARAT
mmetsp:Transcript_9074/g.26474  ORF Transcript_9074/g.26474 Transcript_9074/m.26474 type:complete len:264 (+) Transcript_9074:570-1361(+)